MHQPTTSNNAIVPYITTRVGERLGVGMNLRIHPTRGLCYAPEFANDRDSSGALWARRSHNPRDNAGQPTGEPLYAKVHPSRQRECMYELRCQICCREPASRTSLGYLFLLEQPDDGMRAGWPEGELTRHPPLCLPHAKVSVKRCPPLRRGHVAVRVKMPRLYGIKGLPFTTHWDAEQDDVPDDNDADIVSYRDPRIRWYLATQLVRRLCGVTVIDLTAERAAAELGR
ncbi:hypothetical protein [Streptomyces varsoviensis]|uniref:Uncharacterized protein n=1 Tax=Streptomyces varsoviensis TaxID=67373 RepID=A0ABR5J598_9ACTN|nr:hypothetical protein [Streptomyces varsoviensis]KOG88559.1 hypothetical protein ADK38_19155 [Streptomyces varsoviensis]